jgi:hypothetical protein
MLEQLRRRLGVRGDAPGWGRRAEIVIGNDGPPMPAADRLPLPGPAEDA